MTVAERARDDIQGMHDLIGIPGACLVVGRGAATGHGWRVVETRRGVSMKLWSCSTSCCLWLRSPGSRLAPRLLPTKNRSEVTRSLRFSPWRSSSAKP